MARGVELRPSQRLKEVGSTTPGNKRIPFYVGHADGPALRNDYGAPIESMDTGLLGTQLSPLAEGADRKSVFQSNTGGQLAANNKLIVENVFAYESKPEHQPPPTWERFSELFLTYDGYTEWMMRSHPDTYMTVTTPSGLSLAMRTNGRIGILKSVEGMPEKIDVPLSVAADTIAGVGTQVLDLMWNQNTDVGDSHTTHEDNGLTLKGAAFLQTCADAGIPVFDVSHASPKTAMDMIELMGSNRRVIASHTGARIGTAAEKTRNITDDVARAIYDRGGIVGVATAGGMLGGNNMENIVNTVLHFVELDPTGGKLVTLGHDLNGLGVESMIPGAVTVLDTPNIANALIEAGFTEDMVKDILWRNAYDFWHSALEDVKKPA